MNVDSGSRVPPHFSDKRMPLREEINPHRPGPALPVRELTPDEIKVWKDCSREAFFVAAVPFAVGMQFFKAYRNKSVNTQPNPVPMNGQNMFQKFPFFKSALAFTFNLFIGHFLYTPICYSRLQAAVIANERKFAEQKEGGLIASEETLTRSDDINFQSNLDPNLDGPESNFSHLGVDFDPNISDKLILEDDTDEKNKIPRIPETTYDDLRKQNREKFGKLASYSPQPGSGFQDSLRPAKQHPSEQPSQRKVIKNKYGDEME